MSTTTPFKPLGELYLRVLVDNAYHQGAAGTIADAVNTGSGGHSLSAAERLTHDAMGLLEHCIGLISNDWTDGHCDWARVNELISDKDTRPSRADQIWLHEQLDLQADRAWRTYSELIENTSRGLSWAHQLAMAATFLQAAALLVADAFGIEEDSADG